MSITSSVIAFLLALANFYVIVGAGAHDKMDDGKTTDRINRGNRTSRWLLVAATVVASAYGALCLNWENYLESAVLISMSTLSVYFIWLTRPSTWPQAQPTVQRDGPASGGPSR